MLSSFEKQSSRLHAARTSELAVCYGSTNQSRAPVCTSTRVYSRNNDIVVSTQNGCIIRHASLQFCFASSIALHRYTHGIRPLYALCGTPIPHKTVRKEPRDTIILSPFIAQRARRTPRTPCPLLRASHRRSVGASPSAKLSSSK